MAAALRSTVDRDLPHLKRELGGACSWIDLAVVLEEKLGPAASGAAPLAVTAEVDDVPVGVAVLSANRLRLLAVSPRYRNRGIGSQLLERVEGAAREQNHATLSVLDEPGNYLAPGIAAEDHSTLSWLDRRGYQYVSSNHSLAVPLARGHDFATRFHTESQRLFDLGYTIRRATDRDDELLALIDRDYSPSWRAETARALGGAPPSVLLAARGEDLAAFAVHDGNNRGLGWFGPAATWPAHRGQGIGRALLYGCLDDVASAGHARCLISWIGPRAFYEAALGPLKSLEFRVLRASLL